MKTVLLVDDSPTILMSLETVLTEAGFRTILANNAEEAMELVKGERPDLVITDLNMPGRNGIELIQHLRTEAGLRFNPILMLTTESQADKRAEAKAAGATGWLVKPVKARDLLAVVKKVLPNA